MRFSPMLAALAFIATPALSDTIQDRFGTTGFHDPAIEHAPGDGVVRLFGAGGPHSAFSKVARAFEEKTGFRVVIIAGPEASWTAQAQAQADILWGTSQQSMAAFLVTYTAFELNEVRPVYLRPAVIAVKAGNPKNIRGFDDLLAEDVRIVVTEGAGVYNTSGTGVWEDVAGRLGKLEDLQGFKNNIVSYALGSGASYREFERSKVDAWITWPNWPATKDDLEMVELEPERVIYRDVNVVLSPKADHEAAQFLDFLVSEEASILMASEGWIR
ncbi:Bacterial extracellular solute-binding protein [Labrenzia sp. THAF82]|uniref:extracellular solute-binding protein n=1 Tax=Labrenzia sp. THAF82 TaxID=2587861 RepID=UPI0012690CDD|nr:extracellular solute-binding protein [Labrenzia sp. THAF82]QFT33974.1 Bacterial extracellular solute-binding protein [Labrenzia sp. THAF82]